MSIRPSKSSAVNRSPSAKQASAFTLIELLVVIGVIAILMSFLMPAIVKVRNTSKATACVSNQRVLVMAWTFYCNDNEHLLVSSDTSTASWASDGALDSDIRNGALFRYVNDTAVYKCPGDADLINQRSYSMNWMLNGQAGPSAFVRLEQIRNPSKCFVTVEEYDPRGYNLGSFCLPPTGDSWVDFLPNWHNGGFVLSFADGRAEFWKCEDPRTLTQTWFYASTPNNPDLKRFQEVWAGY